MKIHFYCLLFVAFTMVPLIAENPSVIGKVNTERGMFSLVREKNNGKTTLSVMVGQDPSPVWTKVWADFPDGGSLLDYWQIIDGTIQGNDAAFLLGMHRGILWVKATKANGTWTVDFAQELYGAASPSLKTKKIALKGTDSVVVTNDKDKMVTFTRGDAGTILKDGTPFKNTPPYSTITKP